MERVSEFVASVLRIARDMKALREKNKKLDEANLRMQRQLDEQSGQLRQLGAFVQTALNQTIDQRAARAAVEVMSRLLEIQQEPTVKAIPPRGRTKRRKKS